MPYQINSSAEIERLRNQCNVNDVEYDKLKKKLNVALRAQAKLEASEKALGRLWETVIGDDLHRCTCKCPLWDNCDRTPNECKRDLINYAHGEAK